MVSLLSSRWNSCLSFPCLTHPTNLRIFCGESMLRERVAILLHFRVFGWIWSMLAFLSSRISQRMVFFIFRLILSLASGSPQAMLVILMFPCSLLSSISLSFFLLLRSVKLMLRSSLRTNISFLLCRSRIFVSAVAFVPMWVTLW